MIGELFQNAHDMECFRCKVEGACDQTNELCGIRAGVKKGIYPYTALTSPSSGISNTALSGFYGVKEVPLYNHGDGFHEFTEAVAKYHEPWMRDRDGKLIEVE